MPSSLKKTSYLDFIIEKGIISLLIFTPLAFGSVQDWSTALMEIACFIIFGIWLYKTFKHDNGTPMLSPLLYFPCALLLYVLFQLLPLPSALLSLLSPDANKLQAMYGSRGEAVWRTISLYPGATWEEWYKLLAYTAIFIVMINHYRTREQIKSIVRVIIAMGCLLAVFAVLQKMTWNGRIFWLYPISDARNPMGPYINRNHFAAYMEMAIPLCLGLLLYRSSRIKSEGPLSFGQRASAFMGSREFPAIALLSIMAMTMAGALFVSLSRGGMTGFALSMIFFVLMARTRRSLRKKTGIVMLLGLVVFVIIVQAGWSGIEARFEDIAEEDRIQRWDIWVDTVGMIRDYPVFGTGYGTFGDAYLRYQSINPRILYDHAHNDYVELLTDLGLLGAGIVAGFLVVFWRTMITAWQGRGSRFVTSIGLGGMASCVAIAVHSVTDFNLHIPANALLLTVIAGITYATVFHVTSTKERRKT